MTNDALTQAKLNAYSSLAFRARVFVLISYFGLLCVFTLSIIVLPTCGRSSNAVIWGLHMLPLLIFIIGLLKQNVRSHVWLAFISLGYFSVAVTGVFGCQVLLSYLEVAFTIILFTSALLYIRWRSRELRSTITSNH